MLSSPKGPLILALVGQDIATYNSQAFPTGWAMLALQLDQTNSSLLASAVLYSNSTESLQWQACIVISQADNIFSHPCLPIVTTVNTLPRDL